MPSEAFASLKWIIRFLRVDIWRIRLSNLPRKRSLLIRHLRVVLLALRGFDEDKCHLRASALTFFSLLSIVPLLALGFGIAKGFGYQAALRAQLLAKFPSHEEILLRVIEFAEALLENTKGGMIAGIGVIILFWTVIKVFGNIEKSFNDIWGVKKPRSMGRKFGDYLSMILICPILFIVSSSVTVFVASQLERVTQEIALLGTFAPLIEVLLKLLPFCVIWTLFTFIYIFMPNTKVNLGSGFLAGVVAGTMYQLLQWVYVTFQIGVAKYNAIYGSFAALPLFLVWLQFSWFIVLLGAEMSFAHQNVDTYEFEPDCLRASRRFKRLIALRTVHLLVRNFCDAEKPLTETRIAQTLEIPIRLVREALYELTESGIVSEIKTDAEREVAYQPAQCVEKLTASFIIEALDNRGNDDIPVAESEALDKLSESLKAFSEILKGSTANVSLKDL